MIQDLEPTPTLDTEDFFNPLEALSKDIIAASATLSTQEVRFLVDNYYSHQENRKASANQLRSMPGEPNAIFRWAMTQEAAFERRMQQALDAYTVRSEIGRWLRSVSGVGPVIAAGLISHIDITKAPTAGHIWHFAGIAGDDQRPWGKGEKRPHNAKLKTLCWKVGQSFMKNSNRPDCLYGHVYRDRKALEVARNERGELAEQAAKGALRVNRNTEAYKHYSVGKLPPGHLDARARRYAVKLFLSHFHEVLYRQTYHTDPPKPYPIAILGHAHYIRPAA